MRALVLSVAFGLLFGCGRGNGDAGQDRTTFGGGIPEGQNGDATVACSKPQLNLKGAFWMLAYERKVECGTVTKASFAKVDELDQFSLEVQTKRVFAVTFKEPVTFFPYTSPAHVVITLDGDATIGNCAGTYSSTATVQDAVTGSVQLKGLHFLGADGSCGEALDGTAEGKWTTQPG